MIFQETIISSCLLGAFLFVIFVSYPHVVFSLSLSILMSIIILSSETKARSKNTTNTKIKRSKLKKGEKKKTLTDTHPVTSLPTRGHAQNLRTRSPPSDSCSRSPACDVTCFRDRREDNSFSLSFLQRKVLRVSVTTEKNRISRLICNLIVFIYFPISIKRCLEQGICCHSKKIPVKGTLLFKKRKSYYISK